MVKVIIYTVCFVVVVGLSLYGINKLYQWGWTGGYAKADALWKGKATEALNRKIINIEEFGMILKLRALKHKKEIEKLDRVYAEDLENVERGKDMAIAAVLDGTIKLREPFDPERIGRGAHCKDEVPTAGITVCAPVGDDSKRRELHPKTSAFLFGESLRADLYTEQLGKCQDAVKILEKNCGEQDANSTD